MDIDNSKNVYINNNITIPLDELTFSSTRSSGPGGQHVNKVSTKVTLLFDLLKSDCFSEDEKKLLFNRLSRRITKNGIFQLSSQKYKSQLANKQDCLQKFQQELQQAFAQNKPRKRTKIPYKLKYMRLELKKRHAEIKRNRQKVQF